MNSLFGELLPDWIDPELWDTWVEMRKLKGKRAPLTERAKKLLILKLAKLRAQGHPVNEIIAESAMNGWSGFFPMAKREFSPTIVSGAQPVYIHKERPPETPEQRGAAARTLAQARAKLMNAKVG